MNGERALQVLGGLLRGERGDATDEELEALARPCFVTTVDAARLARARAYGALREAHAYQTAEEVAADLADLEARLQSPFHRMITFAATLRREERKRAQLRGLLGAMRDPQEWARVQAASEALATVPADAPWLPVEGGAGVLAVTALGWRAVFALQTRLARYGAVDFEAFAKRFRKSEAGMKQLGEDYGTLARQLGGQVSKGLPDVVTGLLKTGLPPEQALARYAKATCLVRGGRLAVEVPHAATAVVRAGARAEDQAGAHQELDRAVLVLCSTGLRNTPVLRGAAKALVGAPHLPSAVARFRAVYDGLPRAVPAETRLRCAARLFPARGTAPEVLDRMARALATPHPPAVAAALAASATDASVLPQVLERYAAIVRELVARRAFTGRSAVPASAAELVNVPGEPDEVVELVRQLVAHLPAHEDKEAWGTSADWTPAVAFARRFAY
jgi:hypothetical protein